MLKGRQGTPSRSDFPFHPLAGKFKLRMLASPNDLVSRYSRKGMIGGSRFPVASMVHIPGATSPDDLVRERSAISSPFREAAIAEPTVRR